MTTSAEFEVPFTASRFAPGALGKNRILRFHPADLAHALFVTGRAPGDRARHGLSSVWEFIHRTSLVPSYIRFGPQRSLVRSSLATELDRSEKVALSYALGQAMTGIFCRQELGVAHLLHFDRYARHYTVAVGAGRQRPDFVARAARGWIVAEAKGRSNAMESALESKLIGQKRSIASISGEAPALAVGCVAAFPAPGRTMVLHAFDPPEDEPEAIEVRIDIDRYLLAYYEPFVTAVDFGVPMGDTLAMRSSLLGPDGLRVGVHEAIYDAVGRHRLEPEGLASRVYDVIESAPGHFGDGTEVGVDWTEALALDDWATER